MIYTAPKSGPHNVRIDRLPAGTAMNVSFIRLSIVEAASIHITYTVSYSVIPSHKRQLDMMTVVVPDNQQYVVVDGLDQSVVYHVRVDATNRQGTYSSTAQAVYPGNIVSSISRCISLHFMCIIAPAGAPQMFKAVVGEREVTFSWSSPVGQENGIIASYNLSCSPSLSFLPHQTPSGPLTVTGFTPDTAYSCSVVATNSQGTGPPATITFTTQQDCN